MANNIKKRNYCFTKNNYTDDDITTLLETECKYIVIGREIAPTTGTPHLQCFVQFHNEITWLTAKTRLSIDVNNLQQCNGTPKQNETYCKKEGNWEERGTPPKGQGTRTDLVSVYENIQAGAKLDELVHTNFTEVVKYHRGIALAIDLLRGQKRQTMTIGYWLHGATGTGKSRWAYSHPLPTYSKDPTTKWFDGYEYEPLVVIDDYRSCREFPFQFLLRLCDGYPLKVETKGGSREFNSKIIIVTCPVSIDDCFKHLDFMTEGSINQLKRRFREIDFNMNNIVRDLEFPELSQDIF